jgi:hypothetical protein
MSDDVTLAAKLFAARARLDALEDELFEVVQRRLGIEIESVRFDPYDASLEIEAPAAEVRLTDEAQAALWALGFSRCWVTSKAGESYYASIRP